MSGLTGDIFERNTDGTCKGLAVGSGVVCPWFFQVVKCC